VLDHRRDGAAGLISMFGVRYTTARHTAAAAIDAVFADRGVPSPPPSETATRPVIGGEIGRRDRFVAGALGQAQGLPRDVVERLALTYGTRYTAVAELLCRDRSLASPLGERCGVTRGEILHATLHESAATLSDAVIRRTEAGSAGHPGDDALASAAAVMAAPLGWNASRVAREIEVTRAFYDING
jgi:glycerol-3-phosphate dehydrogenase